jgi:hypothetical protein
MPETEHLRSEIKRVEELVRAEIKRIDDGQKHIITQLASLQKSQGEQTQMLKPISDYFAFGRVTKTIFIGLAGLAAFITGVVTTWKTFLR